MGYRPFQPAMGRPILGVARLEEPQGLEEFFGAAGQRSVPAIDDEGPRFDIVQAWYLKLLHFTQANLRIDPQAKQDPDANTAQNRRFDRLGRVAFGCDI